MTEATTHVYLCTGCPLGCRLEVDAVEDDVIEIRGFGCRIGERYGRQEHLDPRRWLTTTVWVEGAALRRLPVRTAEPIPKARIPAAMAALHGMRVRAPVRCGDVVLGDVAGTGVNVLATRTITATDAPSR